MNTIRTTFLVVLGFVPSVICLGQNQGNPQPQPILPDQQTPRAYTLPLPIPRSTSPFLGEIQIPLDSILQKEMAKTQKKAMKGHKPKVRRKRKPSTNAFNK